MIASAQSTGAIEMEPAHGQTAGASSVNPCLRRMPSGDLFSATTILENTASNGSASPGAGREPPVEILDLDACVLTVSIPVVHKPMIAARPLTERFAA